MYAEGVTIIIPNWNHEYLLPRSVLSALRAVQNLREHQVASEILVVDDDSRDGSLTLLRQFEALYFDAGLRVAALAQNGGVQRARNHGMVEASYRHILFVDADNEIVPENTYHFYRAITQTQAAVVYGNLIIEGRGPDPNLCSHESFQDRIYIENYIDTCAMMDQEQITDAGGFTTDPRFRVTEDWELYLSLAANGRRIVFVPLIIGIYHALPDSLIAERNRPNAPEVPLLRRIYNQVNIRDRLPLNTRHLRYHPDLGYL